MIPLLVVLSLFLHFNSSLYVALDLPLITTIARLASMNTLNMVFGDCNLSGMILSHYCITFATYIDT